MSRSSLRALAVVRGRHTFAQPTLADALRARLVELPDAAGALQMNGFLHERSGIAQRHLELTLEELGARADWYCAVNEATESLARRALSALFQREVRAELCDALVVASSSWAGFPSLSRRLQERAGVPLTAPAWDLGGLGCAAPTHALSLATMLLDRGASNVCVVIADAMGTHGMLRRHSSAPTMAQMVAHAIASDGAAAMLVSRTSHEGALLDWRGSRLRSRLWTDSLDQNDLTADEHNQPLISVGKDIRTRLLAECRALFDDDVRAHPLLMHPGGSALMQIVGGAYPELADTIGLSLEVLRQNGNVGAPSLLFVLEEALRSGRALGPKLNLFALGPGIVATMLTLEEVEVPA